MTARNNSRMHLPFLFASHFPNVSISLVSRSLSWKFLRTMITEDTILFPHGNRNWFQCFPVYPGLNSKSGSGSVSVSGSGSGFRISAFLYAPSPPSLNHVASIERSAKQTYFSSKEFWHWLLTFEDLKKSGGHNESKPRWVEHSHDVSLHNFASTNRPSLVQLCKTLLRQKTREKLASSRLALSASGPGTFPKANKALLRRRLEFPHAEHVFSKALSTPCVAS